MDIEPFIHIVASSGRRELNRLWLMQNVDKSFETGEVLRVCYDDPIEIRIIIWCSVVIFAAELKICSTLVQACVQEALMCLLYGLVSYHSFLEHFHEWTALFLLWRCTFMLLKCWKYHMICYFFVI